jgi:hypothetical protein
MNLQRCGLRQTQTLVVHRLGVLQRRPFRCPLRTTDIDITHRRCVIWIGHYQHTISLVGGTPHFQTPLGTHPYQDCTHKQYQRL